MIEYTLYGKCRKLSDVPPGATVTSINGRDVVGRCDACEQYITDGQHYDCDVESGAIFHSRCPKRRPCHGR